VGSSFDDNVTPSIITILKIEVSRRHHWELQFSNSEKGPKSEENDPPLLEGWLRALSGRVVLAGAYVQFPMHEEMQQLTGRRCVENRWSKGRSSRPVQTGHHKPVQTARLHVYTGAFFTHPCRRPVQARTCHPYNPRSAFLTRFGSAIPKVCYPPRTAIPTVNKRL